MSRPSPFRDSISPPTQQPPNPSSSSRTERTPHSPAPQATQPIDSSSDLSHRPATQSSPTYSVPHETAMQVDTVPTEISSSPFARSDSRHRRRPSFSSSSQEELVDTDIESSPPDQPSGRQTSAQQVKKKRTRTLTTPNQSAVLHALLARSRFPTTAMREEVGRQIGLSARKVQIWFQNQRQKARRPHGHNIAPHRLDRPPQFGPFPAVPMNVAPPESSHGSWIGSNLEPSQAHAADFGIQPESSSRQPTAGSSLMGLIAPRSLQTVHPLDRPPSHNIHVSPSVRMEGRVRRREDRDTVDFSSSSNNAGDPLTSNRSLPPISPRRTLPVLRMASPFYIPDASNSPISSIPRIPPPFTIEPQPHWQPDPVLPVGLAWRGWNLFTPHQLRSMGLAHSPEQSRSGIERIERPIDAPGPTTGRRFDPVHPMTIDETPASPSAGSQRPPDDPDREARRRHGD